ncbi:HNH endonuclease signature motif containing protein [Streptomyces uncialis]|uniref:HNH endonuclease signature motif containing protein n=1 Tax=Streptomyces uncialis TaxID=1048205 RepID=UPI0037B61D3E
MAMHEDRALREDVASRENVAPEDVVLRREDVALREVTRVEVELAIEEFDRLGRDVFLDRYGYRRARSYLLVHGGRSYDSKALLGVAHGFLPGRRTLRPDDLSGGAGHAARLLTALGFEVTGSTPLAAPATPGPEPDAQEELLHRIGRLKVNRAKGGPALYQPIALLWAVGHVHQGSPRLMPWSRTHEELSELLSAHGLRRERPRPDYPVAALHRAGLWELTEITDQAPTAHGDAELRRWFDEQQPTSGLTGPVHRLLRRSGTARLRFVDSLLTNYFADLNAGPLLTAVGLNDGTLGDDHGPAPSGDGGTAADGRTGDEASTTAHGLPAYDVPTPGSADMVVLAADYQRLCRVVEARETANHDRRTESTARERVRSAAARRAVMRRSLGDCENPGCTGRPMDVTDRGHPLLEVDHVDGLADGGRDHPALMVALCPNCHAVKTRGRTRHSLTATLLAVARTRHEAMFPGTR